MRDGRKNPWLLLGMVVVLTVAADLLLYGIYPVGSVAALLFAALWALVLPAEAAVWRRPAVRFWTVMGGLALVGLGVDPDFGMIVLAIAVLVLFRLSTLREAAPGIGASLGALAALPWAWPFALADWRFPRPENASPGGGCLRQLGLWAFPVLFGLIFLAFFASANPVISSTLSEWSDFFSWKWLSAFRIFFWAAFFAFASLLVVGRLWRWLEPGSGHFQGLREFLRPPFACKMPAVPPRETWLPAVLTRGLALFNVLFLIQNVLDVEYLWAGRALPAGMSYAEYAHRGAYPLIATALLAGFLVLITFGQGTADTAWKWPRRLVYLFLGQNVFLVISSILRLGKYVDAYSLTYWRVAAALWMLLVAVGLVLLMVMIGRDYSRVWVVRANAMVLVALLGGVSLFDLRGFIADYNVAHCREAAANTEEGILRAPLDRRYLQSLGAPALPARYAARQRFGGADEKLGTEVRDLERVNGEWRSWSLRRSRIMEKYRQTVEKEAKNE